MTDGFSTSLASGPHALLAGLIGDWGGMTQTSLMPGELGDESETTGTVRAVLGCRFVVHEYRGSLARETMESQALRRRRRTTLGVATDVRAPICRRARDLALQHSTGRRGDEYLGVKTRYRRVD